MSESREPIALDRTGRERPSFIAKYPQGEARLDTLVAAFERGDFRSVKQGTKALLADSPGPELRVAAEDLLRRTQPDPLILVFLGLAATLVVCLTVWVYA